MKHAAITLIVIAQIACMQSAAVTEPAPRALSPATPAATNTPLLLATHTPTPGGMCAIVTAAETVNIRLTPNGDVIGYLHHNDTVQVIQWGDWVQIDSGGFVKSDYLELCK